MKTNSIRTVVLLVSLTFSTSVFAEAFQGNDESTRANCQRYRENITKAKEEELKSYIPQPANEAFATGTCLDSIMNTRINIFTMGSLDSILGNLMNMVTNRACNAVLGQWNQAVGKANGALGTNVNVPYVGNVAGVGIGTGFGGSPVNVNGQPAGTATTVSGINGNVQLNTPQAAPKQTALQSATSKFLNIFK